MRDESLPLGWERVAVSEICIINPKVDKTQYSDNLLVSFVPMPAVEAETGQIDVSESKSFKQVKKGYTAFQESDVLFAKITPCMENGKMAVVPKLINGVGFGSTEFHVLRASSGVIPEFIYYFVSSKMFRHDAEHNMTGAVGQRRVPTPYLEKAEIILPPFNEQRRIVAKIEELFSKIDKGVESLKTAKAQLQVYRQALLKHAFEGKLTAQWRADNPDKAVPAEQLLEQIKQAREDRYQQQLDEWKSAVEKWELGGKEGKKPGKPKQHTKLDEIRHKSIDGIPSLPENWCWSRPEELCSAEPYSIGIGPFGSNLKISDYRSEGIPLIFVRNITKLDFSLNLKYIEEKKFNELKAHSVQPLDILITKMGDPPGDCAIYPKNFPIAILTADCLKFRIWDEFLSRDFFRYCMESNWVKAQLGAITKGVAQKKISVARFKSVLFPVPPLEEQRKIASQLDHTFSMFSALEKEIDNNLSKSEALRQSILKNAFSGQLVPQDPTDEPASQLLARIQAGKAEREINKTASQKNRGQRIKTAL